MTKTDPTYKGNDRKQPEQTDFTSLGPSNDDTKIRTPVTFRDYNAIELGNNFRTCGSRVSDSFTRVYVGNDGIVQACPACSTRRERAIRESAQTRGGC
ncbi:DUF7563 family protein [Haloferax sulfurifontis]